MRLRGIRAVLVSGVCAALGVSAASLVRAVPAVVSVRATVLSIKYGDGANQVDSTRVEYGAHWKSLIANYRVMDDGSLWLMTAGGFQALRHFRPDSGRGVQVERIDLPMAPGGYDDFLFAGDAIVLSQSLYDMSSQAAFYRVAGDSIVEKVMLDRRVGFNRMKGWGVANLGRLRKTGTDLYNCFARNSTCIKVGDMRLSPRLEPEDLVPGLPILSGELVWSDRLVISRGIVPVVDLSDGAPAQLEEVFDDGSFVVRRVAPRRPGEESVEQFEIYDADGARLREINAASADPKAFTVGEGEVYFFAPRAIYQLVFTRKGIDLVRY